MIRRLGAFFARVFYHCCPDPLVIAILLTVLTAVLAYFFGHFPGAAPGESRLLILFDAWRSKAGIWKLLEFALQMCLVLVTGYALAETRMVRRLIERLADLPRTPAQAAALVGLVACVSGVINWGLSLIVGALVARDVGRAAHRRGLRIHYPLVAAAGYFGLMVWHGGLSGSGPLTMTSRAGAMAALPAEVVAKIPGESIGLDQTIFSLRNLVLTGGLIAGVPLLLMLLTPRQGEEIQTIDRFVPVQELEARGGGDTASVAEADGCDSTIPARLDRSPVVVALIALPLLAAVARFIWLGGGTAAAASTENGGVLSRLSAGLSGIGLNEINATMLALGLLLHGSVRSYLAAAEGGARACSGILIQFPLFGGVIAMMQVSGLVGTIAGWFAAHGTATTVPLMSFFAACLINLFVPSGGAQWAIQGPVALESAMSVGITDLGKMVMTVAYGDQTTNMLQPFWALPLLAITGVRARDIVGYSAFVMFFAMAWLALGLLAF